MRFYRLFKYYLNEDLEKEPRVSKCTPVFAVVAPNRAIAGLIFLRQFMLPLNYKFSQFREFTISLQQHPLRFFTPFFARQRQSRREREFITPALNNDTFNIEFIKLQENKSLFKTSNHSFVDAMQQFKHLFPEQKIPLEIYVVFNNVFAILLGSGRLNTTSSITSINNNVIKIPKFKSFLIRHQVKTYES